MQLSPLDAVPLIAVINDGQGFFSALYAILWVMFNIGLPLGAVYGMCKGLFTAIHRADYGSAIIIFICGITFAFVPPLMTFLFKIDAASIAAAKLAQ